MAPLQYSDRVNIKGQSPANTGSIYQRPRGEGDTYDDFDGVGLPGLGAGTFEDDFTQSWEAEIKTDPKAARQLKRRLAKTGKFKNIEVAPTAQQNSTSKRSEVFKGVSLFNRWRIGPYEVKTSDAQVTNYVVKAEIPVGGGSASTSMKMSEASPPTSTSERGWYFFD